MKRSKLLGLAFMVMLVITAITATTALAAATLPSLLPEATAGSPVTAVSESKESVFGSPGITAVTSASSLGETSQTSLKLGTFHTSFLAFKNALLGTCTGTGDASGVVLVLGEFHFRDNSLSSPLTVVVFLLKPSVQFVCGTTAVTLTGCMAGGVTPTNTLTKALEEVLATANGDNDVVTVLNEENTAQEACQLLSKVGAGATELAALQSTQLVSGFKHNGAAVEVLVMPL
jgi:hypothetical protein